MQHPLENRSSSSRPNSHDSPASADDLKRAAALWAGMGQVYGRRFANEFGEKPSPYWVREVATLSDGQLRNGMERLRRENRPHPPTLGEFVTLCRNADQPVRPLLTGPSREVQADHWHTVLNLMLLPKVMRARGVSQEKLADLLAYKREVADTLRAAYGEHAKGDDDRASLRDMEAGIQSGFDRIIRA
jgi:hypothetical protein